MNCVDILFQNDLLNQNRPGIIYFDNINSLKNPQKNVSFKEFGLLVGLAQKKLLEMKVDQNDSALIFELPSPGLYAVITALLALGIKVLLVEPWLPVSEINHIIEKVRPKIFVRKFSGKIFSLRFSSIRKIPFQLSTDDFFKAQSTSSSLRPFSLEVEANHIGILTFTSGTTGKSKGVARTHQYLIDQRDVIGKYIDYQNLEKLDLTVFTNLTLMNLALGKGSLIIAKWKKNILSDLNKLGKEFLPDSIASGPYFLELLKNTITNENFKLETIKVGGALSNISAMEALREKFRPQRFFHVYGSTEAEPVAFCDMNESLKKSKELGFYQCLFLGQSIPEITYSNEESLWVAGKHVSAFYLNDELSNMKNKKTINGLVYHNMGDRIQIDNDNCLWYQGRDFQTKEDFLLEQKIYSQINSSEGFIFTKGNEKIFVTSTKAVDIKKIKSLFPEIESIKFVREIFKDRRHLSRLDRHKTLIKNNL